MNLDEIFASRKSCRSFAEYEMPTKDFFDISDAFSKAPYASGGPRRRLFVSLDSFYQGMADACVGQKYAGQASAVFVLCGKDPDAVLRSGHAKYIFDCSAACMCMDLKAVELGYRTCWIGNFYPDKIRDMFSMPDEWIPTIILLVGVPK